MEPLSGPTAEVQRGIDDLLTIIREHTGVVRKEKLTGLEIRSKLSGVFTIEAFWGLHDWGSKFTTSRRRIVSLKGTSASNSFEKLDDHSFGVILRSFPLITREGLKRGGLLRDRATIH